MSSHKYSHHKCEICGISKRKDPTKVLFSFPRQEIRRNAWIAATGKIELHDIQNFKNKLICQDHFSRKNFVNNLRRRLVFNAVPDVNIKSVLLTEENKCIDQDELKVEDSFSWVESNADFYADTDKNEQIIVLKVIDFEDLDAEFKKKDLTDVEQDSVLKTTDVISSNNNRRGPTAKEQYLFKKCRKFRTIIRKKNWIIYNLTQTARRNFVRPRIKSKK